MKFSQTSTTFVLAAAAATSNLVSAKEDMNDASCKLLPIPTNPDDFDEPDWESILELAFPKWAAPANGCPRLDALGGTPEADRSEYPTPEEGKFNPCYYTKAFAGLDPMLGGYPTPIDTKYFYEFAAPYLKQPGDGSTHHCPHDAVDIGACPKVQNTCGKDCATISDDVGIGHIPPFVPLAAIKNAYNSCAHDICNDWFDFDTNGCSIKKDSLDDLVFEYFGDNETNTIKFQGPVLIDGEPSSTYYRLEYGGESPACDNGNCRGPHYCTQEVAEAGNIWGDFCPYVHTGENSGKYRHPHLALAALELWIANQCMPDNCPAQFLDSPNGKDYASDPTKTSTSIVWSEMVDNEDPMAQPSVPYVWPNSGSGVYPGFEALYGDNDSKEIDGAFTMPDVEYVASVGNVTDKPESSPTTAPSPSSAFVVSGSLTAALVVMVGIFAL